MSVRKPIVSGSFYPSERKEIENIIDSFGKKSLRRKAIGAVVPHAGYVFSGKTALSVYKSIEPSFETIVMIGPNHNALGGETVSSEEWQTPMGISKPDLDFIGEITKSHTITDDNMSQNLEHSLEVQLPFIQRLFRDVKIVPISMNPYHFDVKTCKDVGEIVAQAAKKLKRKVLIVASSDFTHYGASYGYEPFKNGDVVEKIRNIDMEVIESIKGLNPEKVIELCEKKKLTICGYGAIAAMLFTTKKLGAEKAELIDYSTSFEVSKNRDAIVGYAGILVT
jgi:MEMO1 family protein